MLSILIPIYNFEVVDFVSDLHAQGLATGIPFEIRCYDDLSKEHFKAKNASIAALEHVNYVELETNIGRSAIRNRMAEDALFEQLLFLDCDSETESNQFIAQYIPHLHSQMVICGGRTYAKHPPKDDAEYFRWFYGTHREVVAADVRSQAPYRSFMTNNFVVPKTLFLKIRLNEELKGYGHEDTLFGEALKKAGIPLLHINNPVCHIGLDPTEEFLAKTRNGIKNLRILIANGWASPDIKLYRYYKRVKRWGLAGWARRRFERKRDTIEENLKSSNPSLREFDLYKLGYLLLLEHQSKSA